MWLKLSSGVLLHYYALVERVRRPFLLLRLFTPLNFHLFIFNISGLQPTPHVCVHLVSPYSWISRDKLSSTKRKALDSCWLVLLGDGQLDSSRAFKQCSAMQSVCAAPVCVRSFSQASCCRRVYSPTNSSFPTAMSSAETLVLSQRRLRFWRPAVCIPAELSHKNGRLHDRRLTVEASSSGVGAGSFSSSDDNEITPEVESALLHSGNEQVPKPRKYKGSLQAVGLVAVLLTMAAAAALALTLRSGGPEALLSTVSRSGFPAAFSLIFVSEIGDKTFFIAALLAMRHNKWLVLLGASGALSVMTGISVVIGRLFRKVPASLQTTLPVGEYAAVALLLWFGLRSIKNAWDIRSTPVGTKNDEPQEMGELAEAEEFLKQVDDKKISAPLEVLGEAFTLIFVAEWGDRSMLATIALGAAQSPWGVASGAIVGHVLATLLAVVGGALLARYLSEKMIGYIGGFLFLGFAAATLAGVF